TVEPTVSQAAVEAAESLAACASTGASPHLALLALALLALPLLALPLLALALRPLALLAPALLARGPPGPAPLRLALLALALLALALLALALFGLLAQLFLQRVHSACQARRLLGGAIETGTALGLLGGFGRSAHALAERLEILRDAFFHRRR